MAFASGLAAEDNILRLLRQGQHRTDRRRLQQFSVVIELQQPLPPGQCRGLVEALAVAVPRLYAEVAVVHAGELGEPVVELPLCSGAGSSGAFSVAWSAARGVCVGGDYRAVERDAGSAAYTDDGGRTWRAAAAGGYRSGVAWVSSRDVVAVGSHGASWSTDSGRTFAPFGGEAFHSVARAGDGAVWACGANGRVARLVLGPHP